MMKGMKKIQQGEDEMKTKEPMSLPALAYEGGTMAMTLTPVVQTQDLTVINVTKEALISRQAKVMDQLPPIAGKQRATFAPVQIPPPAWWAEALIPID
jgi:hypothetical protein